MAKHFNITGALTQELLAAGDDVVVSSISLANVHADTACTVSLYMEKKLIGKFFLIKKISIPTGVTLIHDIKSFNNKTGEFGLYIQLDAASGTPAVDVILS